MTVTPESAEVSARRTRFAELDIGWDSRILEPRPWTVAQAEWAADVVADRPGGRAVEFCAGAGQIGLWFTHLTNYDTILVDADEHACAWATQNARSSGLGSRVEIRHTDLRHALHPNEKVDVALIDPPWVRSRDVHRFPADPLLAIDGGTDGLAIAFLALDVVQRHVHPGGDVILQLGDSEQVAVIESYLDTPCSRLTLAEARTYGTNGVLVHLRSARNW